MSGVGATDPWASAGSYFDPSGGSGYISNGELLAWLANVTGDKWGELREEMMTTDARHELMEDLGNLKTEFDKAADTKNTSTLGETIADLKAKYAGTNDEAKIDALVADLEPVVARVDQAYDQVKTVTNTTYDADGNARTETFKIGEDYADDLNDDLIGQLETWSDDVQNKVDRLGRDDQLALIRIQELQSNISQQVSLASNLIKSDDQAKSAVIMNIKG
jgi:phage-related protein